MTARAAIVGCAALVATTPAWAAPSDAEKEAARALMDQGDRLVAAHDDAAALKAYQAADDIMGVPTTGIEVARTERRLGRLVEAEETARRVARYPKQADEPQPFTRARAEADAMVAELGPKLATLRIELRGAAPRGVVVEVDGHVVPAAQIAEARKVDPGQHFVGATAAGYVGATEDVALAPGETRTVRLRIRAPADCDDAPDEQPSPTRQSPLVVAGAIAAGAGVAVGAGFGVASLSNASAAREHCTGSQCSAAAQPDIDRAKSFALVSDIAFGVAAAGAVVAVVGLALPSRPAATARVAPYVGVASAGVRGSF